MSERTDDGLTIPGPVVRGVVCGLYSTIAVAWAVLAVQALFGPPINTITVACAFVIAAGHFAGKALGAR